MNNTMVRGIHGAKVNPVFKWVIPVVCDYNIKYQNDIRWVSQNTTLYYGVRCQKVDMFRPFSVRPSSGLTWWTKEEKITMLQSTYIHIMLWPTIEI